MYVFNAQSVLQLAKPAPVCATAQCLGPYTLFIYFILDYLIFLHHTIWNQQGTSNMPLSLKVDGITQCQYMSRLVLLQ